MPSTVVFNDTFNWISTGGTATVAVTVTADAPGYEGKFLWNYNIMNTSYFTNEEFDTFGVSVEDLSAVTNLGNDMGWTGSVGTNVSWSGSSVIEPGGSGNFWFATLPTVTVLSSAFAGAAVGSVVAPAPALVVTTALDVVDPKDAWVSLREAVEFVNDPARNLANHERITFKSTLDGGTITLDPGPGKGQLDLKANVHIDGPTNGITVQRDASSTVKHRIFDVFSALNAKLTKLTLRNGESDPNAGGAIRSVGNLIVENCTFAQNKATGSLGGAIAATAGSLTVTGGGFTGNSAAEGGAIYIGQRVNTTITGSSITLNTARAGGGIFIENSTTTTATTVTLSGVDVNGNSAVDWGGGIFVKDGGAGAGTTLTLTGGTTIRNNIVTSSAGKGGGIFFGKGTLNLVSVTIGDNTANQGDGIYWVKGTTRVETPGGVSWNNDTEFFEP